MEKANGVRARLEALADPAYAEFQKKLLPGVENILGVRLPLLRKEARALAKARGLRALLDIGTGSFEEVMLQGMVIGCAAAPPRETLAAAAAFLGRIDNWSVCDSFCAGLKTARQHPDAVWAFLLPLLRDERPFAVRFAVVMLLTYYIDEAHIAGVLAALAAADHPHYYVRMAVAWAFSMCYVAFPAPTLEALARLPDSGVYNKALQKICESRRVDAAQKAALRAMRRPAAPLRPDFSQCGR